MKFSCVIFICPLVIASVMAMVQFSRTTFTSCDPDEWVMTNTTLEWSNNTKMITCNITYKEADNRIIYRIHIMIGGCKNRTACTEEPTIWVEDINCNAQNLTESDMDACIIANELGKLEKQEEWLKLRYGLVDGEFLYKLMFCINFDDIDLFLNGTSQSK
ncbi:uncharacterized protein [Temnothorax longispinosus]